MNKEEASAYTNELNDRRSRFLISDRGVLNRQPEFVALKELIEKSGETISDVANFKVIQLESSDFNSVQFSIGLALLANYFFKTDMGISGVSITESHHGKISFGIQKDEITSFMAEKQLPYSSGRNIYYIDIVGVDPWREGSGIGRALLRPPLEKFLKATGVETTIVSRTQNPMLVSALKSSLPDGLQLFPFYGKETKEWVDAVNWLVHSGQISRNNRSDTRFDATESLISWGAYGRYGDGTTWENMIGKYEIDWNRDAGNRIKNYLEKYGTSLSEMLFRGHALMIGAYIKKNNSLKT